MSIDNRIVRYSFDNSNFENNAKTTLSTLMKLKNGMNFKGMENSLNAVNDAGKKVTFEPMANALETVKMKFSAMQMVAFSVLNNIVNTAVNAGKRIVKALTLDPVNEGFGEYELKMNSVQTIMAGTGESLERVMGKLNELNTYADKTIYSFSDMTSNIGKFTNAGVKLDDAVAAIQGVANVAALSGANAQNASHAMYNFAQALSAGYVKLIDWKSIETANMATVGFKEELIKTAVELGTLTKQGDMYITTTKDMMGKTSQAFNASKMFNESLSHQWMTTDVLTKTLARYSDETTEVGKKAFAAAQDVKTFHQLLDTLKEAVGSGWAETFENIFGDFEEAKTLWTGVNNVLSGFISKQAEARNTLLSKGLATGWKQFIDVSVGKKNSEEFSKIVQDVAKNHNVAIDEMMKKHGSFSKTLQEKWMTTDILSESLTKYTDKIKSMSEKELEALGYTRDEIQQIKTFSESVDAGQISLSGFVEKINQLSGRENLIKSFSNVFNGLKSILEPIGKAWDNVFNKMDPDKLFSFTVALEELTSKFKLSEKNANRLENIFTSLFKVLHLGTDIIAGLGKIVWAVFDSTLFSAITTALLSFGDGINKVFSNLLNVEAISNGIGSAFDIIGNGITKLINGIAAFSNAVFGVFSKAIDKFTSFFGDTAKNIDILNTMGLTGIIALITKLLKTLTDSKSAVGGLFDAFKTSAESISDVLDTARNSLQLWQTNLKAKALKEVAKAVALLSGSLLLLSTIDPKGMAVGLTGLASILVMLGTLFTVMSGAKFNIKQFKMITQVVVIMGAVSKALLVMSAALKIASTIKPESMISAIIGITSLSTALVLMTKALSGPKALKMTKGINKLIAISVALNILVVALKNLSELSWNELGVGLVGLAGLMSELVVLSAILTKTKGFTKAAISLIPMVSAISLMVNALKSASDIKPEALKQGLIALASLMGELVLFAQLSSGTKGMIQLGVGLTVAAAGINLIAKAVGSLGSLDPDKLVHGMIALGSALLALGVAANTIKITGAAAITLLAGALAIMVPPLVILSTIPLTGAIAGITGLAGAFAVMGISAVALGPLVPVIFSLAAALATISVSVALFGAGVLALGTGITALTVGITTFLTMAGSMPLFVLQLVQSIVMFLGGLLDGIIALVPKVAEAFTTILKTMIDVLVTNTPTVVGGILTFITELLTVLADSAPKIIEAGATLVINLILAITEKMPELVSAAFLLIVSFINGLATAIEENHGSLNNAIGHLIKAILEAIGDAAMDFVDAGKNVVRGFIRGIENMFGWAKRKAKEVFNGITGTVKSFLGIASPSKLFASYGDYTIQGYVVGCKKALPKAMRDTSKMAESLSEKMSNALKIDSTELELSNSISPVIDMTDANKKTKMLSGMLSKNKLNRAMTMIIDSKVQNDKDGKLLDALSKMDKHLGEIEFANYSVNGINVNEGSDVASAINTIVKAAIKERRK